MAFAEGIIPIIDVEPFLSARFPDMDPAAIAVAKTLGDAFERTGFAVVINHGVPPTLAERAYEYSRQFHDLPAELKERVKNYVPHGHENVSQLIGNMDKPNDISDRLKVDNLGSDFAHRNEPRGNPGNPAETAAHDARSLEYTADELVPGLQAAAQEYFDAVAGVWWQLNRMSAVALDLPSDFFDPFYPKPEEWGSGSLRCYPTLDSADELEEGQLRFGGHTDSGGLTLLRTDMEGLQTFVDNEWHDIPVVPHGLVINVARLLARWTNDRWTAAIHRVKNDGITTHRKLTLGMFT
eukprot:COSAG05_NODE_2573_length_2884_cov_2.063555_1_plen_295_part_00